MSILNFINTKTKTFVVFLFSIISLGIFLLSTSIASIIFKQYYGIIFGTILMVIAIPFHCYGKKHPWGYIVSYIMNSIANGFSLSALYLTESIELNLYSLFLGAIPAGIILFLVYLMMHFFHKTKRVTMTIACILNAILTIILIVLWIMHGDIIFSFGFFSSLISFFYLCVFGVTINNIERLVLRDISFGSFGSFIILTVVVIFVLSEGEILDGLDAPDLDFKNGKNKRKK